MNNPLFTATQFRNNSILSWLWVIEYESSIEQIQISSGYLAGDESTTKICYFFLNWYFLALTFCPERFRPIFAN